MVGICVRDQDCDDDKNGNEEDGRAENNEDEDNADEDKDDFEDDDDGDVEDSDNEDEDKDGDDDEDDKYDDVIDALEGETIEIRSSDIPFTECTKWRSNRLTGGLLSKHEP